MDVSESGAKLMRLHSQGLASLPPGKDVEKIVGQQIAIQAQDIRSAGIAIWARGDVRRRDVDEAVSEARIVRTWLFRGTLHYVRAGDIRWLIKLLAPVNQRITARHRGLGLDEDTFSHAFNVIDSALAGKQLTRAQLGDRLERQKISAAGQRLPHILAQASFAGLICQGPRQKNEATYVLLDEWVKPAGQPERDEMLWRLAEMYLEAYGPASASDFKWWTGLPSMDVTRAIGGIMENAAEIEVSGRKLLTLKSRVRKDSATANMKHISLLPAYDNYLLAYRDRSLVMDRAYVARINAGGGVFKPCILMDGRVVGRWGFADIKDQLSVSVETFEKLPDAAVSAIGSESERLGRFFEMGTNIAYSSA